MPLIDRHPDTALLHLHGPDIADLLQRISTAQIAMLAEHEGAHACFLHPTGKIVAAFTVWKLSGTEFAIEIERGRDGSHLKRFLEFLEKMTFSETYETTIVDELECIRWFETEFSDPVFKMQPMQTGITRERARVSHQGTWPYGRPWLTLWAEPSEIEKLLHLNTQPEDRLDTETLAKFRIEARGAAVDHEITEDITPLDVGMAFAVADQKGCYPGQETVEKIISLGSPAKKLASLSRIDETGSPKIFDSLARESQPDSAIGHLTTLTRTSALALVSKTAMVIGEIWVSKSGARYRVENLGEAK